MLVPANSLPSRGVPRRNHQTRIAAYRPQTVVTLVKRIKPNVEAAMAAAGCTVPHYALPFPGQGWQWHFHSQMLKLAPQLPRLPQLDHRP
jgi:hypothetical protein